MRVGTFLRAVHRDIRDDESGVTVLMVAVSILALFGGATIAVDGGNLWSNRRHVIVASDAAALAAASDYAIGRNGCATAGEFVTANDDEAEMTRCRVTFTSPTSGFVTVTAETPVEFAFAGVLGFSNRTVGSTTSAAWGVPSSVGGLRPFGLCVDDPNFQAWAADPTGVSPPAKVPYTNEPTDCGGAPGNWGIIDLDNTPPVSNSDIHRWIRRGYAKHVPPGHIGGDPGAFSNDLDSSLEQVKGSTFPIPLFDDVTTKDGKPGGGQNAVFHVIGFVGVELVGWKTTGAEHSRYLEIRFVETVAAGTCCATTESFGLSAVRICDVDPELDSSHCTT